MQARGRVPYLEVRIRYAAVALCLFALSGQANASPDWNLVAKCEEAGNWHFRGSIYSGGLGFYNPTWTKWASKLHLARRFPNAADAPPAIQKRVALYGWRHHGFWGSLWNGCASDDGGF